MKKAAVILLGVILLAGVVLTGEYGLSEENTKIYESAVALEAQVEEIGFDTFHISDYPVAYYDGDKDYVLTVEDGEVVTAKRKPVLNAIAATAYPVEEHYEVLVPTVERMSSLVGMASLGEADYTEADQVATLWHEAFHCFQLTNYEAQVIALAGNGVEEAMIASEVDDNAAAVDNITLQLEVLEAAVKEADVDKKKEYILQYEELEKEREALLEADVLQTEKYYVTVEGSAYYIESKVCEIQDETAAWIKYVDTIGTYHDGSAKYYQKGMAICRLLDELKPDWKAEYDFSESLETYLFNEV